MDAHDIRAAQDGRGHGRGGALHAIRDGDVEELADERFAGGSDQHRLPELSQLFQPAHDLPVLVGRLPEPDAGIDEDALTRDTRRDRGFDRRAQESFDLGHHVIRVLGAVLVVHDDERAVMTRRELGQDRRAGQTPHVVDHRGAGSYGSLSDVDLIRVDGNRHARFLREPADDLFGAHDLLAWTDGNVARSGGFATDVKEIGAFLDHAQSLRHGRVTIVTQPIAAERIRRDVHDAHHVRAAAPLEPVASYFGDHDAQYAATKR